MIVITNFVDTSEQLIAAVNNKVVNMAEYHREFLLKLEMTLRDIQDPEKLILEKT